MGSYRTYTFSCPNNFDISFIPSMILDLSGTKGSISL